MSSKFTKPVVNFYLYLASKNWGRKLLRKLGPPIMKSRLLAFLGSAHPWRKEKITDMAVIASNLMVDILSDPQRPQAVKESMRAMIRNIASQGKREKLRAKAGVAPAFFVLDWTNRCNLNCYGCYANSYAQGEDLPLEIVDKLVKEFKEDFGAYFVVLSGGEPFLKWKDMAAFAEKHKDITFMVYTNGTLINQEVISGLARLGNISPCISVEGFDTETDARRGEGHFSRVSKLMQALDKAGIIFGFSATVTSQNAEVLASDKFIDYYVKMGCKFGWYFTYIPIGRKPNLDLMTEPPQRVRLGEQIHKWRKQRKPIFIGDFWNDGPEVGGCIAGGRRYFHIDGAGDIKPCAFTPLAAANIHDIYSGKSKYKSVADVVLNSPVFRKMREVQKKITDYTAPCSVIDHPELIREVWKEKGAKPVKSTPEGFFEGEIADKLDKKSAAWRNRKFRGDYLKGGPFEKQGEN